MAGLTPEKRVQNKIVKYLEELMNSGAPVYYQRRNASGSNYKKGLPDIYCVVNGIHIEVEVKAEFGSLRTDQERWQRRFAVLRVPYMCVHSFEMFKEKLKDYM